MIFSLPPWAKEGWILVCKATGINEEWLSSYVNTWCLSECRGHELADSFQDSDLLRSGKKAYFFCFCHLLSASVDLVVIGFSKFGSSIFTQIKLFRNKRKLGLNELQKFWMNEDIAILFLKRQDSRNMNFKLSPLKS